MKKKYMNKYDYGYEIISGSTIEWAFNQIKANSTVLELGPSNGNLIRHLTTEKACIADIIEIDQEAGEQASKFSRYSCIGAINGNLERNEWFCKLKNNQYDYIIILDVLEHIRNPLSLLQNLKELLKLNGTILLSIPNISHNAVILGLLNNKFDYTDVGLLDNTHVHFYTYDSIRRLIEEVGLATQKEELIQKQVDETELDNHYGCLPQSIEAFLKTRYMGTAYQFLFTIKKDIAQVDGLLQYAEDKPYEIVVFNKSRILKRKNINPVNKIELDIDFMDINIMDNEKIEELRIDPINSNCILNNIVLKGFTSSGEEKNIEIHSFSGCMIQDIFVFFDDDPQFYFNIDSDIETLHYECNIIAYDSNEIKQLSPFKKHIQVKDKENKQLNIEINDLKEQLNLLNEQFDTINENLRISKKEYNELSVKLLDEINVIKSLPYNNIEDTITTSFIHENNLRYLNSIQNFIENMQDELLLTKNNNMQLQNLNEQLNTDLQFIKNKLWWRVEQKIVHLKNKFIDKD